MPLPISGMTLFSVTPVDATEAIDHDVWLAHLDWCLAEGADALTLFGSTGANGYFSEAEKRAAFERLLPALAGRAPVMVGIGAMTTGESVRLARAAAALGADAVLVIPLNYWRPTERELVAHYAAIGAATDLPLWVYNNPPLAGIDLGPETMATLARAVPTIVGMKDSSGDLTRVWRVPEATEGRVVVGLGQDTTPVEALIAPSPAWFTGLANLCPAACARLWRAAKSGDAAETVRCAEALRPLSAFGARHGIIRVAHTGLRLLGRPIRAPRAPILDLDDAAEGALGRLMADAGLI